MHTPTPTAAYRATAARSRALLAIFLLAGAGLAYEIALTRLFSLMFQYHYVYLIVSSAVAGLSIGAAVAAWALRKGDVAWGDLAAAAVLLAILLVGAAVVLSQLRSARLTGVALAAALLPFVAIGFLNSAIFARFAEAGGVLYAADLLGGAVGLVAVLGALRWLGALDVVIALGIVAGLVGMILAWTAAGRSARGWAAGATAALVVLLVANQAADLIAFEPERLKDAPPDKTLMQVLENDDSAAIIETRWAPFARLDVVQTADDSARYVFTDAGAGSVMIRFSGDDRRIAWLQQDTAYLPFTLAPETTKNVLILGAGAGQDVLMAHLAGAEQITAVEINPDLVDLTRDYSDYNGRVFDLPSVETVVTDGRNYVERSDAAYDLIYANLVYSQAAAPASSALAESYIFTREALAAYWDHLSENGRIGFVTHHGIEGLRLVGAASAQLDHVGAGDYTDEIPVLDDRHLVLVAIYDQYLRDLLNQREGQRLQAVAANPLIKDWSKEFHHTYALARVIAEQRPRIAALLQQYSSYRLNGQELSSGGYFLNSTRQSRLGRSPTGQPYLTNNADVAHFVFLTVPQALTVV